LTFYLEGKTNVKLVSRLKENNFGLAALIVVLKLNGST